MPDNFDDNSIDNMSINDINELFEDVIEAPDEYAPLSGLAALASWSQRDNTPWCGSCSTSL